MIRIRFIGAAGKYQSIETQAVRIHESLGRFGAGVVESELILLPQERFVRKGIFKKIPLKAMEELVAGIDALVVVKSSLFKDFVKVAPTLHGLCRQRGVVLFSNPCDGPGADGGDTRDIFSEEVADYVFAVSRLQKEAIAERRKADEVLLVEHASRLETTRRIQYRHPVRKVIWENAIHRNPRYDQRKVGMPRERYQELEDTLQAILRERGAEIVFIDAWRETQTYAEWEAMMLDSDIGIECKSLGSEYVDYQSQKPAVKVLNYMALGLPVICDSLPAYKDLGADGKELLFADTIEDWRRQMLRLLDDAPLRQRLGESAHEAAQRYSIENVTKRYIEFFTEAVEKRERPGARAQGKAHPVR